MIVLDMTQSQLFCGWLKQKYKKKPIAHSPIKKKNYKNGYDIANVRYRLAHDPVFI